MTEDSTTPTPEIPGTWPQTLDAWLGTITGKNRADKLARLRVCVGAALKAKCRGAQDSDAKRAFAKLKAEGLRTREEWTALTGQYDAWQAAKRSEQARRNRLGKKSQVGS